MMVSLVIGMVSSSLRFPLVLPGSDILTGNLLVFDLLDGHVPTSLHGVVLAPRVGLDHHGPFHGPLVHAGLLAASCCQIELVS